MDTIQALVAVLLAFGIVIIPYFVGFGFAKVTKKRSLTTVFGHWGTGFIILLLTFIVIVVILMISDLMYDLAGTILK